METTYTWGRAIALRVAVAVVASSLICHVDCWNAGKTGARASIDCEDRFAAVWMQQVRWPVTKDVRG